MSTDTSKLIDRLKAARRMLIFTGAGISTGSGIPDFRGPQGVWTRRKPVYYQAFMTSEAARVEHWDFKLEGWAAISTARPNSVHYAIVKLEKAEKVILVLTQNVDGLHLLAGTSSRNLVELHGTNSFVECQSCHWRGDPNPHLEYFRSHRKTPLCECGGFLKSATISFGQNLDAGSLKRASDAASKADLVIALGSTLSVYPASTFPLIAARRNVPYIIINQGATEHDCEPSVSLRFDCKVEDIFPRAVEIALS
jgi:NAD-dependent deacetylase